MGCDISSLTDFVGKRFGKIGRIWIVIYVALEPMLTIFAGIVHAMPHIYCIVYKESSTTHKKQLAEACTSRYDQSHAPIIALPFLYFTSFGWYTIVTLFYAIYVSHDVDDIESKCTQPGRPLEEIAANDGNKNGKLVFLYFFHHLLCIVPGIILTYLQHTYFYPHGFSRRFNCILESDLISIIYGQDASYNMTTTAIPPQKCENKYAKLNETLNIALSVCNIITVVMLLWDLIYLSTKLFRIKHDQPDWNCDFIMVALFFLEKPYEHNEPSGNMDNGHTSNDGDVNSSDDHGDVNSPDDHGDVNRDYADRGNNSDQESFYSAESDISLHLLNPWIGYD